MKRFKGCLGVFLIFFLGVIFGGILASGAIYAKVWGLIEAGPEAVAEFSVQRLHDELKLDSLQKREFQRIADRTRLRLRALRYANQPAVDEIVDEGESQLRAILSAKQQSKLDELMKRFREKWRAETPAEKIEAETPDGGPSETGPAKNPSDPSPPAPAENSILEAKPAE
ncbi:MAG: hypothetical protein ABI680_20795 [Chthoniobacteraceae bacterium]